MKNKNQPEELEGQIDISSTQINDAEVLYDEKSNDPALLAKLNAKRPRKSTRNNFKQLSLEDNVASDVENKKQEKKKTEDILIEQGQTEQEKFEEVQEAVKKQGSKKKKWLSLIFMLINIGVVAGILAFQLLGEGQQVDSFMEFTAKINWGVIVLLIVLFGVVMLVKSARFWILIHSSTKKHRFALAYKVTAIGRYYDNITPLSSGGEPMQIFYLTKRGIPGAQAMSVALGKYTISQLAYVTFALVVMIFSIAETSTTGTAGAVVTASSWIGFAANSFLVFLIALVSINRTVGTKLISGAIKLLHKMKIIKNYDKQYGKVMKVVNDYQSTMKNFAKEKGTFISVLLLSYLYLVLYYSLPFVVYAAFYGFNFEVFGQIFIYCVMVDLASSIFPLPGGTGAAELSFSVLFGTLFLDGTLFWGMLLWRIFTYYGYIVQGILIVIYDYFRGNKQHEWEEKKWALEEESRNFEKNQLKDFELSLSKNNKKSKNKKGENL